MRQVLPFLVIAILSHLCDGVDVETTDKFSVRRGVPCGPLQQILRSKQALARQLLHAVNDTLAGRGSMTTAEKKVQAEIIELFRQELDQFEASVYKSLNGLDRALAAHYWSLPSVKANFKRRLEGLKTASLLEEENFNAIVELEKRQEVAEKEHEKDIQRNISQHEHRSHRNAAEKLVQDLLAGMVNNVVAAADKVEDDMKNDQVFERFKQKEGAKLETVIKVEVEEEGHRKKTGDKAKEDGKKGNHSLASKQSHHSKIGVDSAGDSSSNEDTKKKDKAGVMSVLIDSHGNKYVLATPAKRTVTRHDWHLLNNLCLVVSMAFLLGLFCQWIGVPVVFGYVLSGVLVGPPGFNMVQSLVQLETLGEIGVYLLLFCVGLDFSLDQLRQVWLIAVCGGCATITVMQLASLLAGLLLSILPQQSCFVAACLTLSSTQLAMRVLARYNFRHPSRSGQTSLILPVKSRKEQLLDATDGGNDLGDIGVGLFGILLMQDIFLALFVTFLPLLAEQIERQHHGDAAALPPFRHPKNAATVPTGPVPHVATISQTVMGAPSSGSGLIHGIAALLFRTLCLAAVCYAASVSFLPRLFGALFRPSADKYEQSACLTLGSLAVLASCMWLTDYIGISIEFGCFVAGILINSQGQGLTQQVLSAMEPIKHLLSAIFFVTIGFHVFPVFLLHEFGVVMLLTTAVVLVKFSVTYLTISSLVMSPHSWMIGLASASVAQVSECAFLVGSRGHRLGLISREVYLLLLCIITMSQLVAPVLWHGMTSWRSKSLILRLLKLPPGLWSKVFHCRQTKE